MSELKKKLGINKSFSLLGDYPRIYQKLAFTLLPLIVVFLLFSQQVGFELSSIHFSLLTYIMVMLVIMAILSKIKAVQSSFIYFHYALLFGVMGINLYWYHVEPDLETYLNFLMAINMVGIALINPKVTVGFYLGTLITFFFLGVSGETDIQMLFLIISSALVISFFNFWRKSLEKNLLQSRKTYQELFDSSNVQKYVLNADFKILDLSLSAEEYLASKDFNEVQDVPFNEVFIAETQNCFNNFLKAVEECNVEGQSSFLANCAIANTEEFIPKAFFLKKMKYFDEDVYLMEVRLNTEQKELIDHKDNVTQILENINYIVLSITFDVKERYRHHINFVSSKVYDVLGYTQDEYISLIKSERLDEDRHPADIERINTLFNELITKGGRNSWRYRMKIRGEWRWIEEKMIAKTPINGEFTSLFGMVKDVTDEIVAQQQLLESESRYRQIFETTLAGVFKTHLAGEILDCNPAFAKILGYDSPDEIMKLRVEDIYHENVERKPYIEKLKKEQELNNYITHLKHKDGHMVIVSNNVSLLPDENGEPNIILGTLVDVTDQHIISNALKNSEEKYRLLFDESNFSIVLLNIEDANLFIVDVNQMAVDFFGYTEKELIGKNILELLNLDENQSLSVNGILKDLTEQESIEHEIIVQPKTGDEFYTEVSFASVRIDNSLMVQLIIKDISERKQYEKEILESRLSFKNIVDQAPSSILIFTEGELAYVNPMGEDIFRKILNPKGKVLFDIFPKENHFLINDLIKEAESGISSYTEIELGDEKQKRKFSINVVNTTYNAKKANVFILQDISLQAEYNIQKVRAELAEETNVSLQEEIKRHKKTQKSLEDSTSRLKALFQTTSNLYIISIDKDFNIVSFNDKFSELLRDYLEVEVDIGDNFMDLFPIEDYAFKKLQERFNGVFTGKPSNMISHFTSKKGDVWMESFISPIVINGEETKEISLISHDITEQVMNRRKILNSEENNRAILRAVPDLLFKADKKGVLTDYRPSSESNKEAFKRLIQSEEVIGKNIDQVLNDKRVAAEIKEHIQRTLKEETVVSHNFSIAYGENENQKVHFENRYSKVNEGEVVIVLRNVTDTVEYEQKLVESVKEKEILLKEVHHRVKNNLQVINSILNLQSSYVEDEETLQIIIESQNRIRSMSYIHESLYQTKDFSSINFHDYITNLVQNLIHSYEVYAEKTKLDLQVDQVELALDQAIPCGLILNELITNSLKYAYPDQEGGRITIKVWEEGEKVKIKVQDFGVGLPKGFKIDESESLGLSLVDTLIDQIDGELKLKTDSGTEFLIIFEKQEI
jgi:PAS domain S-box-containing protein